MNTTIEPMVVRSPLGWDPIETPPRRQWLLLIPLSVLLVAILLSTYVQLPYYALAPGSAQPVDGLVVAPKGHSFPPKGQVFLATISLYKVNLFEAVTGWLRSDVDVVPRDKIVPPHTSDKDYGRFNFEAMDESKQTAEVVALRRLGYSIQEQGQGAIIDQVVKGLPADGHLAAGEVIHKIAGQSVNLKEDASKIITAHKVGDVLPVDVSQADGTRAHTAQVTVGTDPQQGGKPILGVVLATYKQTFNMPFSVDIKSGNIGGPSAGLAFTLGLLDELTPGELTGNHKVAATGTIDLDGHVGEIGGVVQKTVAVKAAGAQVFLVPSADYPAAKKHAGHGLAVYKVDTLQDALNVLGSLGGDVAALSAPAPPPQR